jgi:integration host factor subunit beta
MAKELAKGDRVEIRGFCSFFVKDYGSYIGRNPKTGQRVKIKSKRLPFFKPGKELKERVDGWGIAMVCVVLRGWG